MIGIGDWDQGLGIRIKDCDCILYFRIGGWDLRFGIGDWGLGIRIGDCD